MEITDTKSIKKLMDSKQYEEFLKGL